MRTKFLTAALLLAATTLCSCFDDDSECGGTPPAPASITVATPAELQNAVNQGISQITLSAPLAQNITIDIPKTYPANTPLTIILTAAGKEVAVNQVSTGSASYPTKVQLNADANSELNISTPAIPMAIGKNGGPVNSTAASTRIDKGTTVSGLALAAGDAQIYGTTTADPTNSGAGKVYMALGSDSDRPVTGDNGDALIKDNMGKAVVNGLILTPGQYNLKRNATATGTYGGIDFSDPALKWFLPITKDGFELTGEGERANVLLYSTEYVANGDLSTQDLITVFGQNVKISNLTVMTKEEANKAICAYSSGLTLSNCAILPSDKVTTPSGNGGDVTFTPDATSGTITGCYFKAANVTFDSLLTGTFTVSNNTFDTQWNSGATYGPYRCLATRAYQAGFIPANSTLVVNGADNKFVNVGVYDPTQATVGQAPIEVGYGTFNLDKTTLPTSTGVYTKVTTPGVLNLTNTIYAQ